MAEFTDDALVKASVKATDLEDFLDRLGLKNEKKDLDLVKGKIAYLRSKGVKLRTFAQRGWSNGQRGREAVDYSALNELIPDKAKAKDSEMPKTLTPEELAKRKATREANKAKK